MTELINSIDMNLSFNNETIRVLGTPENPMFVVKDICNILGLTNVTETLRNIPEKWRSSVSLKSGNSSNFQTSCVVNEAGLYKIIMRSNKLISQPFQEFVCEEILPSIRKTGEYKYQKILNEKNKLEEEKAINTGEKQLEESQEDVKKLRKENVNKVIAQKDKLEKENKNPPTKESFLRNNNMPIFKSELTNGIELRILGSHDDPWFVAKDIATMLEYSNTNKAITDHIDKEDILRYNVLVKNGGNESLSPLLQPQTKLINESGLYCLILRSKNEKAKLFKKWVTSEVLPSLRKSSEYKLEERIKLLTEEKEEVINTAKKQLEESQEEVKKLRKKYVKQPKEVLDQKNVVYLMTSEESEKVGEYNVGKALDLSKRKESYNHNKLHNFKVIYYISCKNSKFMDLLESVILMKLEKYRCKAGRDVFLLPTEDITVFTNIFDECSKFYEGIDEAIYPKRIIQEDKEKQKERNIKYQEEHKQEIKEKMHEYYEDNKDILSDIKKEYYEKNADVIAKKQKEYYQDNKEAVIEKVMEYYEENKESILEERKVFYQDNKEHILEERKAHYQENYKTKIAAQRSKKETCECGMIISHYSMKRHKGTDRHKKIMEKIQSII